MLLDWIGTLVGRNLNRLHRTIAGRRDVYVPIRGSPSLFNTGFSSSQLKRGAEEGILGVRLSQLSFGLISPVTVFIVVSSLPFSSFLEPV